MPRMSSWSPRGSGRRVKAHTVGKNGAPAGVPMAAVYTVSGGQIKRVAFFLELDAALEAAGLFD